MADKSFTAGLTHNQKYMVGDVFSSELIANDLRTTQKEIGQTLGLSVKSLTDKQRRLSPTVQKKLRIFAEILRMTLDHTKSSIATFAWFRSERLTEFGGLTPQQIFVEGHEEVLRDYIQAKLAGAYS